MTSIKHPSFYVLAHPTPAHKLVCCDQCHSSQWVLDTPYAIYCCDHRTRLATATEKRAAQAAIRSVLTGGRIVQVQGFDVVHDGALWNASRAQAARAASSVR